MSGDHAKNGNGPETDRAVQRSGDRETARCRLAAGLINAPEDACAPEGAKAFRASIKEPEYVTVTPEMEEAGVERLEELAAELLTDRRYVV